MGFKHDSSQQDKFAFRPFVKDGVTVFPVNCGDSDSAVYKLGAKYLMMVWKNAFRRASQSSAHEDAYFMLLAHPSVIGRRNHMGLLKAIIDYMSCVKIQYSTCGQFSKQLMQNP